MELATSSPKLTREVLEGFVQIRQEVVRPGREGSRPFLEEGMEQVGDNWCFSASLILHVLTPISDS